MRENINRVSSGEIIGESEDAEEKDDKEEKIKAISTGEVEEE